MMPKTGMFRYRVLKSILPLALCLLLLPGCPASHYKKQADDAVYERLDKRWTEEFGPQANYRISDVEPSQQDIAPFDPNIFSGTLTLADAVALATAQSRDYQDQKENLYLQVLRLTDQQHVFDLQFFGLIDSEYVNEDKRDESISTDASLGFNLMLATGGQIGVTLFNNWLRFLTGGTTDNSLTSVLAVDVSQPLLRGGGVEIALEDLTQAQRDVLYQMRNFARFRKQFVVDIINEYYGVLQSLDAIKNAENNFKNLMLAQDRVEMYADSGRRPRFEVGQAQQDMLRARDNLISSQQNYKRLLDRFKITLALPTEMSIQLDPNELENLNQITISENEEEIPLEEAVELALKTRLDLRTALDEVDDAQRKIVVAEDDLGAQLDVVGSVEFDNRNESILRRANMKLSSNRARYTLGLEADLPFDRLTERNNYRRAVIALNQNMRDYQQAEDEVIFDVRQALRDLREVIIRLKIAEKSLEVAQDRVNNNDLLLQAGRAETRDLLEAQEDLLSAQNTRTAAVVSYTVTKLRLYRDIGLLQVKPDGSWQENGQVNP